MIFKVSLHATFIQLYELFFLLLFIEVFDLNFLQLESIDLLPILFSDLVKDVLRPVLSPALDHVGELLQS